MDSKYSYLTKNVILFSIMGLVPKFLTVLLVPLYTSILTTAEYGLADLLTNTVLLLLPIFTVDIQDAVMRFAMDKNKKLEEVFTTAIRIISVGATVVLIGTIMVCKYNLFDLPVSYYILFFVTYITTALYNTISLFCRAIDKVSYLVVGSIINSVTTVVANMLFLFVLKWGITGFLLANLLGTISSTVYIICGVKLYRYIKFTMPFFVDYEMIGYSIPLVFSVIAWWVNSALSRYILTWMLGLEVSGLFATALKIPNILAVFQNIFAQAWSISAIKEFDKNDTDGFIGNTFTIMNGGMCILCSFIMIANIYLAKLLYSKEFFQAWEYVPPLLISVVFNAMALFIGSIFTAVKDTVAVSFTTIVGAVVNIICNLILIKYWGAYGAGIASVLGYCTIFVLRFYLLKRHIRLKLQWYRDFSAYFLLTLQMLFATCDFNLVFQMMVLVILLCLYKSVIISIYSVLTNKVMQLIR